MMKASTFFAVLTGLMLTLSTIASCSQGPIIKASKSYITKEVKVDNFSAIKLLGSGDITFRQGSKTSVQVYGSDNIVNLLEIKEEGGTLSIGLKRGVSIMNTGKLEIRVSSPDLNGLSINGSGNVRFTNGIKTQGNIEIGINGSGDIEGSTFNCNDLAISINGSGDINLQQIKSKRCSARISGSGDIDLSGKTTDAEFHISGSGDISASELEAVNVSATSSGSGDISYHAKGKLSGRVSGSGGVSYKGNPQEIDFPRKGLYKIE